LSVPDADREVLAGGATQYESVALFLDRAASVTPGFAITDDNRTTVVELCRRLEGIPLAIELAAVWLRILSPAEILDRLEDRFRLLTGASTRGFVRRGPGILCVVASAAALAARPRRAVLGGPGTAHADKRRIDPPADALT
jgi:predicted ATPase